MYDNIIIQKTQFNKFILVNSKTDRRLRLSYSAMELFKLYRNNSDKSTEYLFIKFNEFSDNKIDKATLEKNIKKFADFIFSEDNFKISSHLIIHLKIIPEHIVNYLVEKIHFVIPSTLRIFYSLLIFLFIANVVFLTYLFNSQKIDFFNIRNTHIITFCLIVIFIFHEFGHAISARNFGARPKEIGFGFYLLTPALYCNLSDIWKLSAAKRIVINLSGIYLQMLLTFNFIMLSFVVNLPTFIFQLIFVNFIVVLINLNPLLKYDGYWILADSFDTPNLRKISFESLQTIITQKFKGITLKTYIMSLYAITSLTFISFFVIFFVIPNFKIIWVFPLELIRSLYTFALEWDFLLFYKFLKSNLLPIIFYYMLLNISIPKIIKLKQKYDL